MKQYWIEMAAPRFRTSICLSSARLHCAWRTLPKEKQAASSNCFQQAVELRVIRPDREGWATSKTEPWWPEAMLRRVSRFVWEDSMRTWHCWQWLDWQFTCAESKNYFHAKPCRLLRPFWTLTLPQPCPERKCGFSSFATSWSCLGVASTVLRGLLIAVAALPVLLLLPDCYLCKQLFCNHCGTHEIPASGIISIFAVFLVAFLAATVAAWASLLLLASFAFSLVFCIAFGLSKKRLGFNWN